MGIGSFFGWGISDSSSSEDLPEIFKLNVACKDFVLTDVIQVYTKILTDCIERTHGLPDKYEPALWDNFVMSGANFGLISYLACAMATKSELYLVYSMDVLRLATAEEQDQIRSDYEKSLKSNVGIYVSFCKYTRTDMVKIYSEMEYCVISSLNKQMNLSKAIQFKMSEMRSSVSLTDSSKAIEQAKTIATSLSRGRDVMMDGKDVIETAVPDMSAIKESILFLDSKKAFYYSLPLSYINGEQTAGIGSTGEADSKAVERGLKQYFESIVKPTLKELFGVSVTFKSTDFRQIASALETIKTFDLVGDEFLSKENKQAIVEQLFDVESNA